MLLWREEADSHIMLPAAKMISCAQSMLGCGSSTHGGGGGRPGDGKGFGPEKNGTTDVSCIGRLQHSLLLFWTPSRDQVGQFGMHFLN